MGAVLFLEKPEEQIKPDESIVDQEEGKSILDGKQPKPDDSIDDKEKPKSDEFKIENLEKKELKINKSILEVNASFVSTLVMLVGAALYLERTNKSEESTNAGVKQLETDEFVVKINQEKLKPPQDSNSFNQLELDEFIIDEKQSNQVNEFIIADANQLDLNDSIVDIETSDLS